MLSLPLLALSACNGSISGDQSSQPTGTSSTASKASAPGGTPAAIVDPLAAHDPAQGTTVDEPYPDPEQRPIMQAQVVLERLGFTPGVIDGKPGLSTRNAVAGFQQASQLPPTGAFDQPTLAALARFSNIPATRVVTVPADFAAGPFQKMPKSPEEQAKMASLNYETLDEKLAERFHTTIDTLRLLNPGGVPIGMPAPAPSAAVGPTATPSAAGNQGAQQQVPVAMFRGGQQLRVPNVGADGFDQGAVIDAAWAQTLTALGVGSAQPTVAKVVVSKSKGTLSAFDDAGKLVAVFTATMGSEHDPLPLGQWKIQGVSHNPEFHYNPSLFWDAKSGDKKALLPPGPNGPVGVVWIDLNIPHYGIHGTPHPETIGRAESHGCVRLTNWDAARLAQMVHAGTAVSFEP
jgi:lipoprotein-anchoring transpeptidase ErfK/SrfK